MRVTINIPDEIAIQARAKGLSTEIHVEQLLVKHLDELNSEKARGKRSTIAEGVSRIREIGKANKLDGEKIKDWIHEGPK